MFEIPMCNILQSDIFSILKSPVLEGIVFFLKRVWERDSTYYIRTQTKWEFFMLNYVHLLVCKFL